MQFVRNDFVYNSLRVTALNCPHLCKLVGILEKVEVVGKCRIYCYYFRLSTFVHIPPTCRNVWRFINTLATGIAVVIYKMDRCTPVFVTAPVIVTEIRKPAFKTLYILYRVNHWKNRYKLFYKKNLHTSQILLKLLNLNYSFDWNFKRIFNLLQNAITGFLLF